MQEIVVSIKCSQIEPSPLGVNVPIGLTCKSVNVSLTKAELFALKKKRVGKLISQKGEEPIPRQDFGGRTLCTRRGLEPRRV